MASQQIHAILARYTNLIEPLSLDEAYLDVTNNTHGLYASQIAKYIKRAIKDELNLSCSVGVGPNKLIAKIASDIHKPGGITIVTPEQVREFMRDLEVRKIFGVGPATEKRLHAIGIKKCSDIWELSLTQLTAVLGSFANWIFAASQGIDARAVEINWERKSLGREETFPMDVINIEVILQSLQSLSKNVAESLCKGDFVGRTVVLKIKYADFSQVTRRYSFPEYIASSEIIFNCCKKLLLEKTQAGKRKIRLVGVTIANLLLQQPPISA